VQRFGVAPQNRVPCRNTRCTNGPGSAAHRFALHCVRGTRIVNLHIGLRVPVLRSRCGRSTCLLPCINQQQREDDMAESVYKVIELIGTSSSSWEDAASGAVNRASETLRDLRVAEVVQLDLALDAKGKVEAYRARLKVSFKFEGT
jgi:flavin-binding protein dodecin